MNANNSIIVNGVNFYEQYYFGITDYTLPTLSGDNSFAKVQGRPSLIATKTLTAESQLQVTGIIYFPGQDLDWAEANASRMMARLRHGRNEISRIQLTRHTDGFAYEGYLSSANYTVLGKKGVGPAIQISLLWSLPDPSRVSPAPVELSVSDGTPVLLDGLEDAAPTQMQINCASASGTLSIELQRGDGSPARSFQAVLSSGGAVRVDSTTFRMRTGNGTFGSLFSSDGDNIVDQIATPAIWPIYEPSEGATRIVITGGGGSTVQYFPRKY